MLVNLSKIFLSGMVLEVQSGVCGFKDMGWTRISSIDMGRHVFIAEI